MSSRSATVFALSIPFALCACGAEVTFHELHRGIVHNDLTGNGLPDLVIGLPGHVTLTGTVLIYEGGRPLDGLLIDDADVEIFLGNLPTTHTGNAVAICDLDGDGRNDLAIASGFGVVIGALSEEGRWVIHTQVASVQWRLASVTLLCADFDDDGQPDLAVSDADDGISILRGGVWLQEVANLDLTDHPSVWRIPPMTPPPEDRSMLFADQFAVGDFDGDGVRDLAVGYPRLDLESDRLAEHDGVDLFLGGPDFPDRVLHVPCPLGTFSCGDRLTTADFDGDGVHDLVTADLFGVYVLPGGSAVGQATWETHATYAHEVWVHGITGAPSLAPGEAPFALLGHALSSEDFTTPYLFALTEEGALCSTGEPARAELGATFASHPVLGTDGRIAAWQPVTGSVSDDRFVLYGIEEVSPGCGDASPFGDSDDVALAPLVEVDDVTEHRPGIYRVSGVAVPSALTPVDLQAVVGPGYR